ncbi:hypothetical protein ACFOWA_00145 [Pedobacter lithocola]|uniref:6-bladed beta-propeller protein n=1 Tax=Pedobacter lithocola TaxID=1908239 RepID=A0ABV8P780_9SPHI
MKITPFNDSIIFVVLLAAVLLGCVNVEKQPIIGKPKILSINDINKRPPLSLSRLAYDLRYLFLNEEFGKNLVIDQVVSANDILYLLDKSKKKLFLTNLTGRKISELTGVTCFDVTNDKLYTYNSANGMMIVSNVFGQLKGHYRLGFRGVDFMSLNDSTFVFYTGGIITADKESNRYELAFVSKNGELKEFALPISEVKQGINYAPIRRFTRDNGLFFISGLGTTSYQISEQYLKPLLKFDFEESMLTDSIFETFKELESYSFFPYVLNLTNKLNTDKHKFFNFTLRGVEGYIFVSKKDSKPIMINLKSSADRTSDFNDLIPEAYNNSLFVSIVDKRRFQKNYELFLKMSSGSRQSSRLQNVNYQNVLRNNNPIILLYKLRGI